MFPNFIKYNQAETATIQLAKVLQLKVCKSTIVNSLQNHPNYPSILSISDCLKQWQVDNIILQSSIEKLQNLPVPFIAHTQKNDYWVVQSVNNKYINYYSNNGGVK